MEIDLSQGELSLLTTLLEQRCEELRVEVRRTETPSYHDELREYERATLALLHKLERASSEPPSPVATRPTGSAGRSPR